MCVQRIQAGKLTCQARKAKSTRWRDQCCMVPYACPTAIALGIWGMNGWQIAKFLSLPS